MWEMRCLHLSYFSDQQAGDIERKDIIWTIVCFSFGPVVKTFCVYAVHSFDLTHFQMLLTPEALL